MEYDPASPTDEVEEYPVNMDLASIPLPASVSCEQVENILDVNAVDNVNDIPLPTEMLAADIPLPPTTLSSIALPQEDVKETVPLPTTKIESDAGPLKFSVKSSSKSIGSEATSVSVFESSKDSKVDDSRSLPKLQAMMKRSKPSQLPVGVLPSKLKVPAAETKTELFLPSKESDVNSHLISNEIMKHSSQVPSGFASLDANGLSNSDSNFMFDVVTYSNVSMANNSISSVSSHIPNLMSFSVQPVQSHNTPQPAITVAGDASAVLRQSKMNLANMQYVNPQKLRSAQMIATPLIANPALASRSHLEDQSKSRDRKRSRSHSRGSRSGRRSPPARKSRRRHSSSSDSSPRRRSPRRYRRPSRSRRESPDRYSRNRVYSRDWDRDRKECDKRRDRTADAESKHVRRDDRSEKRRSRSRSKDRKHPRRSSSANRKTRDARSPIRKEPVNKKSRDESRKTNSNNESKRVCSPRKPRRSENESTKENSKQSVHKTKSSESRKESTRTQRERPKSPSSSSESDSTTLQESETEASQQVSHERQADKDEEHSSASGESDTESSSSSSAPSSAQASPKHQSVASSVAVKDPNFKVTTAEDASETCRDDISHASDPNKVDQCDVTFRDDKQVFKKGNVTPPDECPLEILPDVQAAQPSEIEPQQLASDTPLQTPTDSMGDFSAVSSVSSLHSGSCVDQDVAVPTRVDAKYDLRQRKVKQSNQMHEQLQALLSVMQTGKISPNSPESPSRSFDAFPDAPRPQYVHILVNDYSHVEDNNSLKTRTISSMPSLLGSADSQTRKEMRHWICDCVMPTMDELSLGLLACGPGCINRALNIECGPSCPAGSFCSNRQFSDRLYAPVEPFYAGPCVGWGLRSRVPITSNTFVIEYVGEVIDFFEFRRRVRRYERIGHQHHYFMSLESDRFIDAGTKGNWARFVNHSCEPNCVTQKWSVEGKIRIGFFALKDIPAGTELTIDYQFAQFGTSEQKCYCGAPSCSGIMGSTNKNLQEKVRLRDTAMVERRVMKLLECQSFSHADDITLLLQVMVQECLTRYTRVELLRRLSVTESAACLKLFRQYNGLDMLAALMCDSESTDWELKRLILICLDNIPVSEQKQLQTNSRLFDIVTQWTLDPRYCRPRLAPCGSDPCLTTPKQTVETPMDTTSDGAVIPSNAEHNSTLDDPPGTPVDEDVDLMDQSLGTPTNSQNDTMQDIRDLAAKLIDKWSKLPLENYRIPRTERQETEKELHVVNHASSSLVSWGHTDSEKSAINSWTKIRRNRPSRTRSRRPRTTGSTFSPMLNNHGSLTKTERRKLFEAKVSGTQEKEDAPSVTEPSVTENDKAIEQSRMADFANIRHLLLLLLINELNISGVSLSQLSLPGLDSTNAAKCLHDVLQALPGMLSNFLANKDLSLLTPLVDRLCQELSAHTAKPSSPLPDGWQSARDPSGSVYFYNMDAKIVQREHPGKKTSQTNKESVDSPLVVDERVKAEKSFTVEVGNFVLRLLKPYRLPNCLTGRIQSSTDMVHIARKLTHAFVSKELKQLPPSKLPSLTATLQDHIRSSLTRYMTSRGSVYKRRPQNPCLSSSQGFES